MKGKKIANAEMTGAWELALAAIKAGQMSADKFSQSINSYVATFVIFQLKKVQVSSYILIVIHFHLFSYLLNGQLKYEFVDTEIERNLVYNTY